MEISEVAMPNQQVLVNAGAKAVADQAVGNAFTVENLDFYYGTFHALKNINMNIKKNEITALIGPSGCGKSTFLRILNRMNDLEGDVTVKR